MKIAVIAPSLANKGPVIVAFDICCTLLKQGHDVKVFYMDEIHELDFPCEADHISFFERIDFNEFDIVHTHGLRPNAYVFFHRRRKHRAKFVSTFHSDIKQEFTIEHGRFWGSIFAKMFCTFLLRHHGIAFVSESIEKLYKPKFRKQKCVAIANGRTLDFSQNVNISDENIILKFKGDRKLIMTAAVLTERKGLYQVIEALPGMPNYVFCVIGSGDESAHLKHLAEKLGVSNQCLFIGARQAAYRYFKYADVYVLPSFSEGFPLAIIEAVATQCPVVASDIEVIRSAFTKEEICFFILKNIVSLQDSLRRAVEHKEKYVKNAFEHYQSSYTVEVMSSRYLDFFKSIV